MRRLPRDLHLNVTKKQYIELFSTFRNFLSCSSVQDIEHEYRCEYVKNTTECQDKEYFFNYIEILYCSLKPTSNAQLYVCLFLFIFLCFIMFIILGITADKFFCPSLEMLSKEMGLSEHLAGVTLLAFGNGSPDLFTSLASIDEPANTMYSNLLGGAIFVTAFVGGFICVITPMHINASNFLRDTTFFIMGIMYIDYAVESNKYVTINEAICIILIYVVYLVVILLDQFLLKRQVNNMEKLMLKGRMSVAQFKSYNNLRHEASIDIIGRMSGATINLAATRSSFYGYNASANENLLKQCLRSLNPIDPDEWHSSSCFRRTLICLKAPMIFLLQLFIPIANYEEDRHGWSKLLNCLQIVTLPFITTLIKFNFSTTLGLPVCLYTLIISIPLATFIFMKSRTDTAPGFHAGFACLTAFGSMFVIYSCASETVEILYVLGLVMNCSNSFLGTTLLAWGNGMGDLISNTALALHGYQKMAFAACYGGPFFNTIFSLGVSLTIITLRSEEGHVFIPGGAMGENCFIFMLIILFCTLMWSLTTNFRIRRSVGIFNIVIYIIFLLYIILGELEVIQTYAEIYEYGITTF